MRIARRGAAWWLASAAVVAMFAGTPLAAAQYGHGDTKTLVTNLDQTTSDRTEVGGESYHSVAVRFHTAERGLGFVLEQIRIETEAPASGLGGVEVLAAIREDVNASIGAVTVSFVPRRVRSGTTTIEAHWAELQGNRWYWLELRARQTGKQFFVATTNSNAEGGEPGSWWINNIHKQASGRYRPDWSGSLTSVDSAAKIALLGQPKYESNLHVSTSPASEGEEIPLRFTVAPALDTEVTVSYETRIESDDTATQSEFEAVTGGSVTIPAGRNVGHATIGTNDDGVDEPDFQTFTVAITGVTPGNRVLLPRGASTKASIVDDDDPPLIGMTGGDQSVAEGASASTRSRCP